MRKWWPLFLILVFCFAFRGFAEIPVTVTPSKVKVGDLLRVTFRLTDASTNKMPDLTPLLPDFTIAGSENQSSYTMVNGKGSSVYEWTILLVANKIGILTIPPLQFGSETTKATTVEVTAESRQVVGEDKALKNIFIKSTVSEKTPFVNQQVSYKVKIYIKQPLMDAQYMPPRVDNALLLTVGQEQQYRRTVNGENYTVSELNYAIFPQKSGTLLIKPPRFNALLYATIPEKIQVEGKPLQLEIKPQPQNYGASNWLPAKDLQLSETYDTNLSTLKQGDTFSRTITIKARGVPGQLLPALPLHSTASLTVYPEKTAETNERVQSDIIGTVHIKANYLLNKSGSVTIPALKISWYNLTLNKEETTILPRRILTITPIATVKEEPIQPQAVKDPSAAEAVVLEKRSWLPWVLVLAFALLWFLTLFVGWRKLRKLRGTKVLPEANAPHPSGSGDYAVEEAAGLKEPKIHKNRLKNLQRACLSNNSKLAKESVILWANWHWSTAEIKDLDDIYPFTQDEALKSALNELGIALYQREKNTWQGANLWQAIQRQGVAKGAKVPKKKVLPPLRKM